jgi:hypothetical protein
MTPTIRDSAIAQAIAALELAENTIRAEVPWAKYGEIPTKINNALASLRSLAPAPADRRDETAWLIELRGNRPSWWALSANEDGGEWSHKVDDALRFSREKDAQSYIDDVGWTDAFACEHMWCATADQSDAGRNAVIEECERIVSEVWKAARTKPVGNTVMCEQILERFAAFRALTAAPAGTVGLGDEISGAGGAASRSPSRAPVGEGAGHNSQSPLIVSAADREAIREALKLGLKCAEKLDTDMLYVSSDVTQITAALALLGEG